MPMFTVGRIRRRRRALAAAAVLLVARAATAGDPAGAHPGAGGDDVAREEAPSLARTLGTIAGALWTQRPEWGDMAVAILRGEALERGKAWWHPAANRFGWQWLQARKGPGPDGRIARADLGADDLLFERLDRDGDGFLSAADFAPARRKDSPGADDVFFKLDRDSNGRVSFEEMKKFFQEADGGGLGYLTRDDLRQAFFDPEAAGDGGGDDLPSPWLMLYMLFTRQLGSLSEGPALGDLAPDFRLPALDGSSQRTLSASRGKRPVVLIFGSFT
jgi:hypothetical protein